MKKVTGGVRVLLKAKTTRGCGFDLGCDLKSDLVRGVAVLLS